jgi:tetratricopeptide (TPR) repeat protein
LYGKTIGKGKDCWQAATLAVRTETQDRGSVLKSAPTRSAPGRSVAKFTTTEAPAHAIAFATPAPMPLVPPLTSATLLVGDGYSRFLDDYLYYARRYDEAVRQYQETLELGPNNTWVYEALGDAFERQGKHDEAIAAWRAALRFSGDEELAAKLDRAFRTGGFAGVLRAMGQEKLQRVEERRGRGEYVSAIEHARAYVRCGDDERALRWLEVASGELNNSPLMIKSDPLFDGLRADPRFASILNSIHLA